MRIRLCVLTAFMSASALLSGCGDPEALPDTDQATTAEDTPPPEEMKSGSVDSAADGEKVDVSFEQWSALEDYVKTQSGKVVVIDVWATWCVPCRKEFPHLVELHNDHKGDVSCVSVNVDFAGDEAAETYKEPVMEFLTKSNATFKNVICTTNYDEVAQLADGAPSLPTVYVYDKSGKLVKRFHGADGEKFDYKNNIAPLVEKLLNDK